MEFFEGTLATLLGPEYGGDEIYGHEITTVCELLKEEDPSKITFTTSDEDHDGIMKIYNKIMEKHCKAKISSYYLFDYNDIECVYKYEEGGLVVIFVKLEDKDKL